MTEPKFDEIHGREGRPPIAPGRLLRALLLQMLYTVRSGRMLMEQLDYNLLFRWFVGLSRKQARRQRTSETHESKTVLTQATGTAEREAAAA